MSLSVWEAVYSLKLRFFFQPCGIMAVLEFYFAAVFEALVYLVCPDIEFTQ